VGSPCLSQPSITPLFPNLGLLNDDVDITQVPASMTIASSTDYGYFKYYTYELNNVFGEPLTGPGYTATEWVTGANPGDINSNGQYSAVQNGLFCCDKVGLISAR
jgi:hypothetical protein